MSRAISDAKEIRDEVNNDPCLSDEHKKLVQQKVEGLQALALEVCQEGAEEVRASLRDII